MKMALRYCRFHGVDCTIYPIVQRTLSGDRLVNRLPTGDDYCYGLPREGHYDVPGYNYRVVHYNWGTVFD